MTGGYVEPHPAELKQATVLFVDLVRSTELVAHLDPESAMQELLPVLSTMREVVARFGGTVASTLGDGIMALFGAPRMQEEHAVLACQAALAIRQAIGGGVGRHAIRAGLHSGEIVADMPMTAPAAGISSAYGMTLHLGSRLAAEVEPGEICISEACYRLVRSSCEARLLGRRTLRGVPQSVSLYALIGMRPIIAGQRFLGSPLSSFLGRDRELAALSNALEAVEKGTGRIVGIGGAAGTGKSRLCYEFAETCRARSIAVSAVRTQLYGIATPLQPIVELLRAAYFRIAPHDAPEAAIPIVARRLNAVGAAGESDLLLVCEFLRIPFPDAQRSWLSASTRNTRLQEILRALVTRGETRTSVIVIEDIHWLDEASEPFLATLAQVAAESRTMLIVNFRQPHSREWMRLDNYSQIDLEELPAADTDALVTELMGPLPELYEIRRRVAERSGGNPFFLEELVQSLAESGVVTGRRGAFRTGRVAVMAAMPATIHALIGARIDGLGERERLTLHIGSIIGKEFQLAILERVADIEAAELAAILEHLCEWGLLERGDAPDGPAYRFRHPLMQEVAYTTQLRSRRRRLHEAVGRAIENLYADRADEYAAVISHHLEEAGHRNSAAVYAARAAGWIGRMSSAEAIRLWHKVRSLMADEPRSPANDRLRIEASGQIAWLGWRQGLSPDQARPFSEEALALARENDDSIVSLLMQVEGRIAQVSGGNSDAFVGQIKKAIAVAGARGETGRLSTLHTALSHAYGWAGLLREALEASDIALANVADVTAYDKWFLGYDVENWIVGLRGRILLRLGRFDPAIACFEQLTAIKTLIDPTVLFIAHFGYVDLAWCRDDPAMASENAARIRAIADRHGGAYLRLYQLASQAIADGVAGDYESAANGARRSIAFLRQTGAAIEFEPELLAYLADYEMRVTDYAGAIETAADAVAMARKRGARLPQCRATITLAILTARAGRAAALGRATALLAEAEGLVAETGACIYDRLLTEARALLADFGWRRDAEPTG